MPPKREGPGRPEKDDEEAIRYVWRLRRENPRIGHREAARRYFQEHPEKLTAKLESEARRVGDKAARSRKLPKPRERERLRWIVFALYSAAKELDVLLDRWDRLGKEEPPEEGDRIESSQEEGGMPDGDLHETVNRLRRELEELLAEQAPGGDADGEP